MERIRNWVKMLMGRLEYCDWCDGTGVIPKGIVPEVKEDASCVECRGTGIVPLPLQRDN